MQPPYNQIIPVPEKEHKPRPFVDLIISVIIPSIILMKLSGDDKLGATGALILALSFPITWGLIEFFKFGNRNFIALLGVVSVLLTGGIGLLKLDAQWLAVKEAAIPLAIGIGVLVANKLGFPLVRKLIYSPALMRVDRIESALDARQNKQDFDTRLDRANTLLAGTFFFSAAMNYGLAKAIVKSDSGTEAFNEELGRMTLLSYPVIAIPSMIMMIAIFYYIWRTVNKLTGLSLEEVMVAGEASDDKE
ncbi:MAG: MFS transporter [Gammaproteobacteria bacterium]|nr:MFS transporter [Gammaproteobacteria bacterium]